MADKSGQTFELPSTVIFKYISAVRLYSNVRIPTIAPLMFSFMGNKIKP